MMSGPIHREMPIRDSTWSASHQPHPPRHDTPGAGIDAEPARPTGRCCLPTGAPATRRSDSSAADRDGTRTWGSRPHYGKSSRVGRAVPWWNRNCHRPRPRSHRRDDGVPVIAPSRHSELQEPRSENDPHVGTVEAGLLPPQRFLKVPKDCRRIVGRVHRVVPHDSAQPAERCSIGSSWSAVDTSRCGTCQAAHRQDLTGCQHAAV